MIDQSGADVTKLFIGIHPPGTLAGILQDGRDVRRVGKISREGAYVTLGSRLTFLNSRRAACFGTTARGQSYLRRSTETARCGRGGRGSRLRGEANRPESCRRMGRILMYSSVTRGV